MEIKKLVIGRKYQIKPKEWFDKTKENVFYRSSAGKQMRLTEIVNGGTLVLSDGCGDKPWLSLKAVEEIPGQPKPSKLILDTIQKLKDAEFIYGYDGGPGGGGGGTIKTQKELILPAFKEDGSEAIYMKVQSLTRLFTIDKINELFEYGECSQGFQATEYSYIRTSLSLIKDKTKLPKDSSWVTMRD